MSKKPSYQQQQQQPRQQHQHQQYQNNFKGGNGQKSQPAPQQKQKQQPQYKQPQYGNGAPRKKSDMTYIKMPYSEIPAFLRQGKVRLDSQVSEYSDQGIYLRIVDAATGKPVTIVFTMGTFDNQVSFPFTPKAMVDEKTGLAQGGKSISVAIPKELRERATDEEAASFSTANRDTMVEIEEWFLPHIIENWKSFGSLFDEPPVAQVLRDKFKRWSNVQKPKKPQPGWENNCPIIRFPLKDKFEDDVPERKIYEITGRTPAGVVTTRRGRLDNITPWSKGCIEAAFDRFSIGDNSFRMLFSTYEIYYVPRARNNRAQSFGGRTVDGKVVDSVAVERDPNYDDDGNKIGGSDTEEQGWAHGRGGQDYGEEDEEDGDVLTPPPPQALKRKATMMYPPKKAAMNRQREESGDDGGDEEEEEPPAKNKKKKQQQQQQQPLKDATPPKKKQRKPRSPSPSPDIDTDEDEFPNPPIDA